MTTTQSFANHHSGTEDIMETGDTDRYFGQDDDLDIDLELTTDPLQHGTDEEMQEELGEFAVQTNSMTQDTDGADILMQDGANGDDYDQTNSVHDEEIQDAGPEEIVADEDVIVDDLGDDAEPDHQGGDEDLAFQPEEHEEDQSGEKAEPTILSHENDLLGSSAARPPANLQEPLDTRERTPSESQTKEPAKHVNETLDSTQVPGLSTGETMAKYTEEPLTAENKDPNNIIEGTQESEAAVREFDEILGGEIASSHPNPKEAQNLHPIYIYYQEEEEEIYLFKPIDQDEQNTRTFLLEDGGLIYDSLQSVLTGCRGVLGESIRKEDEFVLFIDNLDLEFSESSTISSHLSIAQLLETYTLLHKNENMTPPPLRAHLYTRLSSSYRWKYLCDQASEGKGYSLIQVEDGAEQEEIEEQPDLTDDGSSEVEDQLQERNASASKQAGEEQNLEAGNHPQPLVEDKTGKSQRDAVSTNKTATNQKEKNDTSASLIQQEASTFGDQSLEEAKSRTRDAQHSDIPNHALLREEGTYRVEKEYIDPINGDLVPHLESPTESSTLKGDSIASIEEPLSGDAPSEESSKPDSLHLEATVHDYSDKTQAGNDRNSKVHEDYDDETGQGILVGTSEIENMDYQDDLLAEDDVFTKQYDAVFTAGQTAPTQEDAQDTNGLRHNDTLTFVDSEGPQQGSSKPDKSTELLERPATEVQRTPPLGSTAYAADKFLFPQDEIEDPKDFVLSVEGEASSDTPNIETDHGSTTKFSATRLCKGSPDFPADEQTATGPPEVKNSEFNLVDSHGETFPANGHTTYEDWEVQKGGGDGQLIENTAFPSPASHKRPRNEEEVDVTQIDYGQDLKRVRSS